MIAAIWAAFFSGSQRYAWLTGPVTYDDEYNGQTVDARLETPGCKTHDDC